MATVFKGVNSWRCMARRQGHITQSGVFKSKAEATRAGNRWEYEFDEGLHKANGSGSLTTVYELFDRYATEVSPTKDGGKFEIARLASYQDKVKFPEFDCKLKDFGADQIRSWRDNRLKLVKPSSVNRELNLISAVFTEAIIEWKIKIPVNPVRTIRRPPATKPRNRRFQPEELAKLGFGEQAIPREGLGQTVDYIPWMIEFSVETGLRLGEITALQWRDVHLDGRWVHVAARERGARKNGDSRNVPLTKRAEEILRTLGQRDPVKVFPVNKGSVDTQWRKLRKKLGIADLHIHDARHEATTRLSKEFTVLELASITGHKNLNTLLIYYDPTPEELVKKLRGGGPQSTS
jgi:integrase